MSGDAMSFPDDWRTFVQQYQFADKEEVYTNGSMLIPSFRVRQMVEHYFGGGECEITYSGDLWWECQSCNEQMRIASDYPNFCPNCGRKAVKR